MKKRIFWAIGILTLVLFLCAMVFGNDLLLHSMVNRLDSAVGRSGQLQRIEARSVCGKLNGNGNGMQYFGAVLVKADSEETVKALVEALAGEFEVVDYCVQTGQRIHADYLEHRSLSYDHAAFTDGTYYSIYFYNSHSDLSNELDLRGH